MTTRRSVLLASLVLAAACSSDPAPDQTPRGPLGKADAAGTCTADDCGGKSAASCWCDDECTQYGDCCANHEDVCPAPDAASCGGFAGLTCASTSDYCHYEPDQQCGAADQLGTCQPVGITLLCAQVVLPVCGCDGQTYTNQCYAARAGVSVLHDGACEESAGGGAEACGGFAGAACGNPHEYCHYADSQQCGAGDQSGTCEARPDVCFQAVIPVCGCDGQTYTNECFAARSGVSVAHAGACN